MVAKNTMRTCGVKLIINKTLVKIDSSSPVFFGIHVKFNLSENLDCLRSIIDTMGLSRTRFRVRIRIKLLKKMLTPPPKKCKSGWIQRILGAVGFGFYYFFKS